MGHRVPGITLDMRIILDITVTAIKLRAIVFIIETRLLWSYSALFTTNTVGHFLP